MREHVYLAFNAGAKVTLHDVTLPQQATPPRRIMDVYNCTINTTVGGGWGGGGRVRT